MISLTNPFKAHLSALADKPLHSAYVFGAASKFGEALLNQVLANPRYTHVYVGTYAPLPTTIAHLYGINASDFAVQNTAQKVDVFFISNSTLEANASSSLDVAPRQQAYAPLTQEAMPALLSQIDRSFSQYGSVVRTGSSNVALRYCMICPEAPVHGLGALLAPYAVHTPCMAYGLAQDEVRARNATEFSALGNSALDRLGVGVLNLLARVIGQMANPNATAPLSRVKIAQRLIQQFDSSVSGSVAVKLLTQQDLV